MYHSDFDLFTVLLFRIHLDGRILRISSHTLCCPRLHLLPLHRIRNAIVTITTDGTITKARVGLIFLPKLSLWDSPQIPLRQDGTISALPVPCTEAAYSTSSMCTNHRSRHFYTIEWPLAGSRQRPVLYCKTKKAVFSFQTAN